MIKKKYGNWEVCFSYLYHIILRLVLWHMDSLWCHDHMTSGLNEAANELSMNQVFLYSIIFVYCFWCVPDTYLSKISFLRGNIYEYLWSLIETKVIMYWDDVRELTSYHYLLWLDEPVRSFMWCNLVDIFLHCSTWSMGNRYVLQFFWGCLLWE